MALERYDIHYSDGTQQTVTPTLVDTIAFEVHLRNNKHLGTIVDNPFRMQAFRAWSAAKREHGLEVSWAQFLEGANAAELHALHVGPAQTDDTDDAEAVEGLGEGIAADQPTS